MQSQNNIPIVLISDIAYLPGLLALLMSFEVNSGLPRDQKIIILEAEPFNELDRDIIRKFNYEISFADVWDLGSVGNFELPMFEIADVSPFPHVYFWFRKTFVKFFLFRMHDWKKIIFIDVDMLCMNNITEMFNFEPLGVVSEFGNKRPGPVEELSGNIPFCTGFMVIEPDEKVYQGMIRTLKHLGVELFRKYPTGDQIITNYYFYNNRCSQVNMVGQEWGITNRMRESAPELIEERPKLLHYLGIKPWHPANKVDGKLERLWWHYFIMAGRKIGGSSFEAKLAKPSDIPN